MPVSVSAEQEALEHLRNHFADKAKEIIMRDGHLEPIIVLVTRDGESDSKKLNAGVVPVGKFMTSEQGKAILSSVLRQTIEELRTSGTKVFGTGMIAEAWSAEAKSMDELKASGSVKNFPDRVEVIVLDWQYNSFLLPDVPCSCLGRMNIVRGPDNKITEISDVDWLVNDGEMQSGGRFSNMFDSYKPKVGQA